MIATVLGGVPLVISIGAGAEARQALGNALRLLVIQPPDVM